MAGRFNDCQSPDQQLGACLHFDDLLVHEAAAVVQQLHGPLGAAVGALGRLLDVASVASHHGLVLALLTLEHRNPAPS